MACECQQKAIQPPDVIVAGEDLPSFERLAPEAAINEEPSECVSLPYSDELTPNARGEPCPRAGARHERRLLGVGSSAWFGVQGGNRVQRAALLPSGCFSLYASYFPVE